MRKEIMQEFVQSMENHRQIVKRAYVQGMFLVSLAGALAGAVFSMIVLSCIGLYGNPVASFIAYGFWVVFPFLVMPLYSEGVRTGLYKIWLRLTYRKRNGIVADVEIKDVCETESRAPRRITCK